MANLESIETFTVDEVNARIPLVRRIMEDLREAWNQDQKVRSRLEHFRQAATGGGSSEVGDTIDRLQKKGRRLEQRILGLEKEVKEIGGLVRDPGRGIVDYFSSREGHLIYLTWMLGDTQVEYWHEIDADLVDRHRLSDEPSPSE